MIPRIFGMLVATAAGLAVAASAVAQQQAPAANAGVAAQSMADIDLAPEIQGMQGRHLRMRTITVEPGGVIGLHNHQNRPSVEYVLNGSATEVRGETNRSLKPGDVIAGDHTTEHWWRNDGQEPLIIPAVDIFAPQ